MNNRKNISISILTIAFLLFFFSALSQMSFIRYDSIKVKVDGEYLQNPWAGGFNSPQFSAIDLNGDGKKDLFCMERNWDAMIKTYLNKGNEGETNYEYAPYFSQKFPIMHNWALLVDYNCDGKEDIFTSVPAGIAVYKNTGDETGIKFQLVTNLLRAQTSEGMKTVYVSPPDIPALSDIDGDGDLDILSYGILGQYVKYYKNLSMENYGNCNKLEFNLESECWGHFSESSQDNTITLFDSCSSIKETNISGTRHAGSAILAINLNNNGLKDILIGDISYNNIVKLENAGSISEASMNKAEYNFPSNSSPVNLTVFPASYYLDINNDDKKDLLISPNNPNTSENFNNIWLYQNISSQSIPEFQFVRNNFLQDQMIDVGEGARPVFFDANSDGLEDIIIGNYGYFIESADFDSKLTLFINSGTATNPEYKLEDTDYMNISSLNLNGAYPAFGDIDFDGDKDILIGDEDGKLHLFLNNANLGEAANFVLAQANYMDIDIGETSIPQLVDINHDNKIDLLIGEKGGTLNYFENIGSQQEAMFESTPTNNYFGEIDVMAECCGGSSSSFMTNDHLGNFLLYVGSEKGWIYKYNDIEDNINGKFNLVDSLFSGALNAYVSGADINNDEKAELIFGEYSGGISILRPGIPQWIGIDEEAINNFNLKVFPNPVGDNLNLKLEGDFIKSSIEINIFNSLGIRVYNSINNSSNSLIINTINFKPGIYIVQARVKNTVIFKRFVKL